MKIPSDKLVFSHMPYIHDAGGSVSMLLCMSDTEIKETERIPSYRPWRIHSYDLSKNVAKRIDVGSGPLDVETTPVCYYRDGMFNLSFILGKWSESRFIEYDLRLYKMTGKSLDDLDDMTPVLPFRVRAGFEWYGKAVFSIDGRVMHDNIDGSGRYETEVGLEFITKLTPRHDHTTSVLVTGITPDKKWVTLVYDLETRKVIGNVKTPDGTDAYKPTIFENMMAHVVDVGEGDNDYKVEFVKDVGQDSSNIVVR